MARTRGIRDFFKRKSVLVVNLILLLLIGWGFAGEYLRNREMTGEIQQLSQQAQQLESHNLELARLAKQMSEPGTFEKEARLKLNLQKPGEQVVVVKDASPAAQQQAAKADESAATSDTYNAQITNPEKWLHHFFK